jgi:hypothetical protein
MIDSKNTQVAVKKQVKLTASKRFTKQSAC